MVNSLVISRSIAAERATVTTECVPGTITVLIDEMRTSLPIYHAAFAGQPTATGVRLLLNNSVFSVTTAARVGFNDELPDCPINEYLRSLGLPEPKITQLLQDYDLDRPEYFSCAQLGATPARQVALLGALWSAAPVIILNDPFQPFNGRWRDRFGELLLESVSATQRIIVCTNLSFLPRAWSNAPTVLSRDVGHAAVSAIDRAREVARQEEIARKRAAEEAARAAALAQKATASTPPVPSDSLDSTVPTEIGANYRPVYDYIFAPLAELSNTMRRYGLVGAVFSGVFVVVLMALVLFPNLARSRAALRELSASLTWKWSDVIEPTLPAEKTSGTTPPQEPEAVTGSVAGNAASAALPILELPTTQIAEEEPKAEEPAQDPMLPPGDPSPLLAISIPLDDLLSFFPVNAILPQETCESETENSKRVD